MTNPTGAFRDYAKASKKTAERTVIQRNRLQGLQFGLQPFHFIFKE
jgi:hypothetical protein